MAVDKFKFVSPGIFIDEIDESQVPVLPERMGPVVIGQFQKGPANRPITVQSFKEMVEIFGNPTPGVPSRDAWRSGDLQAPTYAAYAAQAWLRNNSPCTIIRLLGKAPANAVGYDSNPKSEAGWRTEKGFNDDIADSGGAYGLFIVPNNITGAAITGHAGSTQPVSGTLAAIWYVKNGGVRLRGTPIFSQNASETTAAAGLWIRATNQLFTAEILNNAGTVVKKSTFNFDRDSDQFIRKVFNTNPTVVNTDITTTDSQQVYWLGETFERSAVEETGLMINGQTLELHRANANTNPNGEWLGVILGLDGASGQADFDWWNHLQNNQAASTGFFFSQDNRGAVTVGEANGFDPSSHTDNLFKIVALDSGEHANKDYKISIQDIKAPSDNFNAYGTFSVVVRSAFDTDNNPIVIERFSNVNLNPESQNYIARVIGDQTFEFDDATNVLRTIGLNPNNSKLVRVEVTDTVKNGEAAGLLPYGVYGPAVPRKFTIVSGAANAALRDLPAGNFGVDDYITHGTEVKDYVVAGTAATFPTLIIPSGSVGGGRGMVATDVVVYGTGSFPTKHTASIAWPTTRLRLSSSDGGLNKPSQAYFGYQSNIKGTKRFDRQNIDLLRGQPANFNGTGPAAKISDATQYQYSWAFTLDDVTGSMSDTSHYHYEKGSRARGQSHTARNGSTAILDAGVNRFTSPMFGGFDGFDITEKAPLRNNYLSTGGTSGTETTNYAYYTIKKAIDTIADPEFVEFDLATIPGLTNGSLNSLLIDACETRSDALAIVDLEGLHQPAHETNASEATRKGSVSTTVTNLKNLNINSSYACTFFPFVQIRDLINDSILFVPPSVVALGTMSSSQRRSAVWFAPAGFTRGGLSEGNAGIPVLGVHQRLTSDDRDTLYDANINPIASFPAEGVVVFGQKTLQVTPSALDRINVRRLMIFVKKEISRIASTVLFDQNVQSTWDRFVGQVKPFLDGVKAGLGLTDFKVVLDETTTTPDLIDRNVLYAKIFLKPAKSIEFIALDFIISRSGASFDD